MFLVHADFKSTELSERPAANHTQRLVFAICASSIYAKHYVFSFSVHRLISSSTVSLSCTEHLSLLICHVFLFLPLSLSFSLSISASPLASPIDQSCLISRRSFLIRHYIWPSPRSSNPSFIICFSHFIHQVEPGLYVSCFKCIRMDHGISKLINTEAKYGVASV